MQTRSFLAVSSTLAVCLCIMAGKACAGGAVWTNQFVSTCADAYVDEELPEANYGGRPEWFVGPALEFGLRRRAFIAFDLTTLPPDAVIQDAWLYLYWYEPSDGGVTVTLDVSTPIDDWAEDTITWKEQPETVWRSSFELEAPTGWQIVNLHDLVREWVQGVAPNRGICIASAPANAPLLFTRGFYSRESASCGAYLWVFYGTENPPPPTPEPICKAGSGDDTPPDVVLRVVPNPPKAGEPFTVEATATGAHDIFRVQIMEGAVDLADAVHSEEGHSELSVAYSFPTGRPPGMVRFCARGWDWSMNVGGASTYVRVLEDGEPPAVRVWHIPPHPVPGEPISIVADAEDPSGIAHLAIFVNGTPHDHRLATTPVYATHSCTITTTQHRVVTYWAYAVDREGLLRRTGNKYILIGNDGADSDGDGLSDDIERIMGLDPHRNDTDGDGLYDHWEVRGFDSNGDGIVDLDLPGMGASPFRKDAFIEVDWMEDDTHTHRLHPLAIQSVVNAFRDYDIALHVDTGYLGGGAPFPHTATIPGNCSNAFEFAWLRDLKAARFDPNRCGIFYYCALLHGPPCGSKSDTGGNLIVRTSGSTSAEPGSVARQIEKFMHELGHNMGLGHGGQKDASRNLETLGPDGSSVTVAVDWQLNDRNNKANHLSCMNYRYQWELKMRTDAGDDLYVHTYGSADYSELDESHLVETDGWHAPARLGAYVWRSATSEMELWYERLRGTYYIRPHSTGSTGPSAGRFFLADGSWVDWNNNATTNSGAVVYDQNVDGQIGVLTNQPEIALLRTKIYGDIFGGFATAAPVGEGRACEDNEPPPDMARDGEYADGMDNDGDGLIDEGFPDADGDGFVDMVDNAPFLYNPDQADRNQNYTGDVGEFPPEPPRRVRGRLADGVVTLEWLPPIENALNIVGYNVYRRRSSDDSFHRLTLDHPTTLRASFVDPDLLTETNVYRIAAVDFHRNESRLSDPIRLPIPAPELSNLWTRIWGGADEDSGRATATDSLGNVYAAGSTRAAFGGQTMTGVENLCLTKFCPAGERQWVRIWGSEGQDSAFGVAVDAADNIYVTGAMWGKMPGQPSFGGSDFILTRFDAEGSNLWNRVWGSQGNDAGLGIAVDRQGHIYVAGYATGGLGDQQPIGQRDFCLTKFDSHGNPIWIRLWGTSADDAATSVASGDEGLVYVAGHIGGPIDEEPFAGVRDACLTQFTEKGDRKWTRVFGMPGTDQAEGVAVDSQGCVYVTGFGGALHGEISLGGIDPFLCRFDAEGTRAWTRLWGSSGDDAAFAVAIDEEDRIFLVGAAAPGVPFDGDSTIGGAFLSVFRPDGRRLLSRRWGAESTQARGVSVRDTWLFAGGMTHGGFHGEPAIGATDHWVSRLGPPPPAPGSSVHGIDVQPPWFRLGDNVLLTATLRNNGAESMQGEIIIVVQDVAGQTVAEFANPSGVLPAGASHTYTVQWSAATLTPRNCRILVYGRFPDHTTAMSVVADWSAEPLRWETLTMHGELAALRWAGVAGCRYDIDFTEDLRHSPFQTIQSKIEAHPPYNTYTDTVTRIRGFYLLREHR